MLKVAVVTSHFPSAADPADGRSVVEKMRVLSRYADVRIFYPKAVYPSFLMRYKRGYGQDDSLYCPPGIKASYYPYPALPHLSRWVNGWSAARALLPHVRAFSPDVIHSYFLYPSGFAALQIGKALSVPVGAGAVGSDVHSIRSWVVKMYTRKLLREVDFSVAVATDLLRRMIAMGANEERARLILNGCDTSVFRPGDRREAREKLNIDPNCEMIAYVGRLDLKKGLRELVEAASTLHRDRPRLQVYMIGEGPDRHLIEHSIRDAGAGQFVHLPGACKPQEVARWLAAADLFTLPSYMEGCPNVVLEALACGRPVVATNVGGIPEIMTEDCGCLVPPRDAPALAQGLRSVLERTWDESAISRSRSRSWDDASAELLRTLELAVASPMRNGNAR